MILQELLAMNEAKKDRSVVKDAAEDFLADFFDDEMTDAELAEKVKQHAEQYDISDEADLAYIVKYFKKNSV